MAIKTRKTGLPARKKKVARKAAPRKKRPHVNNDLLDGLLGFHVRLAMATMRRSFLRDVGDGKTRPGVASLLQVVAANEGASQIELSKAMHVDKASLVALIDSAEHQGWLVRERSREDRRRHELKLTPKGVIVAEKIRAQILRHEKKYLSRFSPKELDRLIEYLQRIYE